ncbi:MAG: tRNA lysidine(34) synthetase TilS [Prevotella sp.]|uniref:tRNA lysidine(34) synthetase TilS n=1 Tax=Prevotella sp. TaxID=59823 RepID=UPI002A2C2A2F|nr:tRNA lysidine(34) synthetase TilS [Prevotella sp.]MDD7318187.1 tRNA lysidine(34) synthetase TilS [Prevotellaceae bacterium]MDY4020924.1 tRNA lysidine(34) synthetase TilS [Prevotella sp.]
MLKRIANFIASNSLLSKDKRYMIALSGGADSVCLLIVLQQLGYDIEAVHCNFNLRGDESSRDEQFCIELCSKRNIKLHLAHFDTNAYALLHKVSIEMAARNLRYSFFENLRQSIDAEGICVAHHQNDCAETVIMNLIRGTGIKGMAGIVPKRDNIIRPLLCVSRGEIEDFLAKESQDYVTDSTNLNDFCVRNNVRLNIIPMLEKINPAAVQNIVKTAIRMNEVNKVFSQSIEASVSKVSHFIDNSLYIDVPALREETSPEYTLFSILKDYGFNPEQIERIGCNLDFPTGTRFLSATHQLLFDRQKIIVTKIENNRVSLKIPEPGKYMIGEMKAIRVAKAAIDDGFCISKDNMTATLDAANVKFPLLLRTAENGDRFFPFGMKGSKLVSKYMTDKRRSLADKQKQLLIEDATGNILWLVGERTDDRYKITHNTTDAIIVSIVEI